MGRVREAATGAWSGFKRVRTNDVGLMKNDARHQPRPGIEGGETAP